MKHIRIGTLLTLVAFILASCTGRGMDSHLNEADPTGLLPSVEALDLLQGDARSASASMELPGKDAQASGGDATVNGDELELVSSSSASAWAIYRFDLSAGDPVESLDVNLGALSGEYWLAIADYDNGRWNFIDSYDADATADLGMVAGRYASGLDHAFAAVLCHGGDTASVASIRLNVSGPKPPDWIHTFGVDSLHEVVECSTFDAAGNIIVGLRTYEDAGELGYLTLLRYSADGTRTAAKRLHFASGTTADFMFTDASGNIFIAGMNGSDPHIMQLDGDLNIVAHKEIDCQLSFLSGVAMDGSGNFYLVGHGGFDIYLLRVNADYTLEWGRTWGADIDFRDSQVCVANDSVFVYDRLDGGIIEPWEILVAEFGLDGTSKGVTSWETSSKSGPRSARMIAHGGGILFVSQYIWTENDILQNYIELLQFDSSMELSSHQQLRYPTAETGIRLRDLLIDSTGAICALQTPRIGDDDTGISLLRVRNGAGEGSFHMAGTGGDRTLLSLGDFGSLLAGPSGELYISGGSQVVGDVNLYPLSLESVPTVFNLLDNNITVSNYSANGVLDISLAFEDLPLGTDDTPDAGDLDAMLAKVQF